MAETVKASAPRKARNPIARAFYFVLGMLCLALIPLSYLPGIPTFDLILLAAFFFSMSSDKMYNWMLNHRYFGKVIRGYRDHGLTTRMKWVAAAGITTSLVVSGVFLTDLAWVRLILVAVGVYALWFVSSRPTRDRSTI
ncbi:MAG TPA: YbaN family protein [Acidimicrobiia bacterium]|nr:YbaN family protein [Acidimicrobiia bacterium]